MRSWRLYSLLAILTTRAATQQITVTPSNSTTVPDEDDLVIGWSSGNATSAPTILNNVSPLVNVSAAIDGTVALSGTLFLANSGTQLNIVNTNIAFISCDPQSYPGFTGAVDVLSQAENARATAILLYSTTSQFCNLTGASAQYPYIYTTVSVNDATGMLAALQDKSKSVINATIGTMATVNNTASGNDTTSGSGGGQQGGNLGGNAQAAQQNPLGPSPSTAVAMIILYSITGVITALFLVIIVTGAVRAHRHPERYGPQNFLGRPRQSRAKGLARAMLETIPIVKFGEDQPPKTTDVELTSADGRIESTGTANPPRPGSTHRNEMHNDTRSVRSGIGSADGTADPTSSTAPTTTPTQPEDIPGCSICTEDFEVGQDLRVLPCDHKFHPACIDPWLLNVSGTCPLCRIDLHPRTSTDSQDVNSTELPPPIDVEGAGGRNHRNSMRRSMLMSMIGIRPMHETSQEERLQVLRNWRRQQQDVGEGQGRDRRASMISNASRDGTGEDERERRRRSRLSALFGIRTRRRGEGGVTEETVGEGGDVVTATGANETEADSAGQTHVVARPS